MELPLCGRHTRKVREREIFIDNLLVRVHLIIEISRPALRHGSLNFIFQVALYLPSYGARSSHAKSGDCLERLGGMRRLPPGGARIGQAGRWRGGEREREGERE